MLEITLMHIFLFSTINFIFFFISSFVISFLATTLFHILHLIFCMAHVKSIEKRKSKHHPKKVLPQQSISLFSSLKSDSHGKLSDIPIPHAIKNPEGHMFDPHSAFNALKSSESNDSNTNLGDVQFAFTPSPRKPIAAASAEKKDEERLPGPPQELKAPIIKARFVILSWKPPVDNADNIQSYSVYYRQDGSDRYVIFKNMWLTDSNNGTSQKY